MAPAYLLLPLLISLFTAAGHFLISWSFSRELDPAVMHTMPMMYVCTGHGPLCDRPKDVLACSAALEELPRLYVLFAVFVFPLCVCLCACV